MLKELASLTWLHWFYTGDDFATIAETVKDQYDLDWNDQNIMDIYQVVEDVNQEYRLYGGVNTKPPNSGGLSLKSNILFFVVILVYTILNM